MKLALGTAQFGLPYGISNSKGQVAFEEAEAIVVEARGKGIETLDTAIAYGNSEASLGVIGVDDFKVITKLPAIPENIEDVSSWVKSEVEASLVRLNLQSVYGVLLHQPQDLLGAKGCDLVRALAQLKVDNLTRKIGVSIYAPFELGRLMEACDIDLVQAPFNIIDQRLYVSGWLQKLHDRSVEVHTRSTFLQGLLLIPRAVVPNKFAPWFSLFDQWDSWLLNNDISATQACVCFVKKFAEIDKIVVGVESVKQLDELILASQNLPNLVWPKMNCTDENLINPSNWNKL